MTFLMICNIIFCATDNTFYSKCDNASDFWQHLELTYELESDLQDTQNWGWKQFVDYNTGKTQLVLFDRSYNSDATDVKINGSVLEDCLSHLLRRQDCLSLLNWIGTLTLFSLLKIPARKLQP